MLVHISFYSYFKDLAGCDSLDHEVPEGVTLGNLLQQVFDRCPRLRPMENAMLKAVGVDYQDANYVLRPGDQVSLFPPVQGG